MKKSQICPIWGQSGPNLWPTLVSMATTSVTWAAIDYWSQLFFLNQGCQMWHPNWLRLAPNGTNLGLFKIKTQYTLARRAPFGANLIQFGCHIWHPWCRRRFRYCRFNYTQRKRHLGLRTQIRRPALRPDLSCPMSHVCPQPTVNFSSHNILDFLR